MDARGRLDQIRQWATEAEKRSGSAYVDERQQWIRAACDELAEFAAGVPNIVERRSGRDRRSVDRVDGEHPMRRLAGARRQGGVNDGTVTTAPTRLLITSGSPLGMTQGTSETSQIDWELYNGVSGSLLASRASPGSYTATYSSDDVSVATVSASGLITEAGTAGTATITVTVDGISTTEQVVVSGAASADHLTVTPTTMALDVAQTSVAVVQVIDTSGNAMAGRTVTASSADTGVVTSGADDDTTNPPTHRFTLTGAGAGGPTNVTFTDTGSSLTVATAVTVSAASGAQPFMEVTFDGYTDNTDFMAKTLTAGGSDVWSAGNPTGIFGPISEFSPTDYATRITLATPGDLPFGLTKCRRYTYPTTQSLTDYTIDQPVRWPSHVTEVWTEVTDRYSSNFDCRVQNPPGNQLKAHFVRVDSTGRFAIDLFYNQSQTGAEVQYPLNPSGASAVTITIPTAVVSDRHLNDGLFHTTRFWCKLGASGGVKIWMSASDLSTFTLIYSFSGTITRNYMYGYRSANQNQRPATTPAMYRDWARMRFYDTDPGWV